MKLVLLNGSPRGWNSNTTKLLESVGRGWEKSGGGDYRAEYIRERSSRKAGEAFLEAEMVVLSFPLYADSMPGIVKEFIDSLPSNGGFPGKKIGFIVHSGFPEAVHSEYVARYLEKLSRRWNMELLGIVIKGGTEGIKMMKPKQVRKFTAPFVELGENLAQEGRFNPELITKVKGPNRFPKPVTAVLGIFMRLGFFNKYWNMKLKENNAWEKRFDQPYTAG